MTWKDADKPRIIFSIVAVVLLLGLGLGGAYLLITLGVEPQRKAIEFQAPLVDTIKVVPEDIVEWLTAYGTVLPIRKANLAAEVSAQVLKRGEGIRAGAAVQKGQVLIRLDDREFQHALERADALAAAEQASLAEVEADGKSLEKLLTTTRQELRLAENERRRVTALYEQGVAAKKEYDFATLAYRQAQRIVQGFERAHAGLAPRRARLNASYRGLLAEAAQARLRIERCVLRAPFSGRLSAVLVDIGDHVIPGAVAVTLIDSTSVELALSLPSSTYDRVRVGAACWIDSESMPDQPWRGEVARIAPVADTLTRTFNVYVVVDNTHQEVQLVPGMFVRARVEGGVFSDRMVVPRSACRRSTVLVASEGRVRVVPVHIERLIGDRALVVGDLVAGVLVITSHLDRLADGARIRVGSAVSSANGKRDWSAEPLRGASP